VLLALTLLSACAATEPGTSAGAPPRDAATGSAAAAAPYLVGRFAGMEGDLGTAADDMVKALSHDPTNPDLRQQAFLATLLAGRPEAGRIARELPDNQVAQLLLADNDARAGNWQEAPSTPP
jgi:Tfp pilus assembly protein PilF